MPVFNAVSYIERAIRSIVEQDYPDKELFIKDGGSKDGTIDIIKHYAKKYPSIIKWTSGKDKGQTDAINIGMKKVSGEILAYLNADDVYKPGSFKKVAEVFGKNKDLMWIYSKCDIIDADDKPIRGWITAYKNFWLKNFSLSTLLILNYISQMGVFIRREAYLKVGEFDEKQFYVMDYDYWLRLAKHFKPTLIDNYLASFRIIPSAKSSTGFIKQFHDEYNVAKKHTSNQIILFLHQLHFRMIIAAYSVMRTLHSVKL
jgi:glycosyltransferase involved in cell wall biosynthesis